MQKKRSFRKRLIYGIYLLVVIPIAAEIALRIYNPFHFRIKGDRIALDVNRQYEVTNHGNPALPAKVINTVNSLGFRGPEPPANVGELLSILTIGGSTTECNSLGDTQTWSHLLFEKLGTQFRMWGNNAGLAGHSTFGHNVLLTDHVVKLRPQVVLFLIGCNDIERDDLNASDKSNVRDAYKNFFTWLSQHSELVNVVINVARTRQAMKKNVLNPYFDFNKRKDDTIRLPPQVIAGRMQAQQRYLPGFRQRVTELVQICRQHQIVPVLVTQPALFGPVADPVTGANLELFRIRDNMNGGLWWNVLELYNEVTRSVAAEQNVYCIDLAKEMPKSTAYFSDLVHYTPTGAIRVSEIVHAGLKPYLKQQFPSFVK